MPIYLFFEFVGNGVHVFDIILSSCLPPHNCAVRLSYIELNTKELSPNYELEEFKRMNLAKVYLPVELAIINSSVRKKKSKINYIVYTGFTEIITNSIKPILPNISEEKLFGNLLLTLDTKKAKPETIDYVNELVIEPIVENIELPNKPIIITTK